MQMNRRYQAPERLIEVFNMIPTGPAWNYLYAVLEPEFGSNTHLEATVKITRGVPSVHPSRLMSLYEYPTNGKNFLVGTDGKRTTWKRIEIKENEPYWINHARTHFLNCDPFNEAAEIYMLKELEFLRNAHHSGDEETLIFDLGIHAYYDRFSEPGRNVLKITENVKNKEMDELIETFDRVLKPI